MFSDEGVLRNPIVARLVARTKHFLPSTIRCRFPTVQVSFNAQALALLVATVGESSGLLNPAILLEAGFPIVPIIVPTTISYILSNGDGFGQKQFFENDVVMAPKTGPRRPAAIFKTTESRSKTATNIHLFDPDAPGAAGIFS